MSKYKTCTKCFAILPEDLIRPDGLCMKCYYGGNSIQGLRAEGTENQEKPNE